jgi:hypothetical protein
MAAVEECKGLLVSPRGTPQKQVVSILRSYPRLPCYGVLACSRCVFCLRLSFPAWPQKVPIGVKRQIRCIAKFWFHSSLDVLGPRRVSVKGNFEGESASIGKDCI